MAAKVTLVSTGSTDLDAIFVTLTEGNIALAAAFLDLGAVAQKCKLSDLGADCALLAREALNEGLKGLKHINNGKIQAELANSVRLLAQNPGLRTCL